MQVRQPESREHFKSEQVDIAIVDSRWWWVMGASAYVSSAELILP